MQYQLVTYRTPEDDNDRYSIVPMHYAFSFLDWIGRRLCAEIVSVTLDPTMPGNWPNSMVSDLGIPPSWPEYDKCSRYIQLSELMASHGKQAPLHGCV